MASSLSAATAHRYNGVTWPCSVVLKGSNRDLSIARTQRPVYPPSAWSILIYSRERPEIQFTSIKVLSFQVRWLSKLQSQRCPTKNCRPYAKLGGKRKLPLMSKRQDWKNQRISTWKSIELIGRFGKLMRALWDKPVLTSIATKSLGLKRHRLWPCV